MQITLTGIDQLELEKDSDDDGLLDFVSDRVQEADRQYLSEKKDMVATIHICTRCLSCPNILVYHIILPGSKEENHFFVEHLPFIVRDMLKKHTCKKHGAHRYAGYIFSSLCRMASVPSTSKKLPELSGDFNIYLNLIVSTEDVRTKSFPVGEDFALGPANEMKGGVGAGGLINIFSVTPKSKTKDEGIYR